MVMWKQKVGLEPVNIAGLDIGTASVKLVQLRHEDSGYVGTKIAIEPIDPDWTSDEEFDAHVARAIQRCFKHAKLRTPVVCGVSGPDVIVRTFRFPSLPAEALEQAVLLEAQQVSPLDTATSVVDYQVVSSGPGASGGDLEVQAPGGHQGIFVAASNSVVQQQIRRAKAASVKVTLMDVDGLALLNCIKTFEHEEPNTSIAVVNVGHSRTNVAVCGDDGLPFVRDLATAGRAIAQSMAEATGRAVADIEKAITEPDEVPGLDLTEPLQQACGELVTNISETLRYYGLQENSAPIRRVLVCGGFALVDEFVAMLDRALQTEVVVFNPFAEIPWVGDRAGLEWARHAGPMLAVATGLAMRTV